MTRVFLLAIFFIAVAGSQLASAQAPLPDEASLAPGHGVAKKKGTVAERVLALVLDEFGDKAMGAGPETRFVQDLGGDRLDIVLLVMAAEGEFGITVSDSDLGRIETVGDLTECVRTLLADKRGR